MGNPRRLKAFKKISKRLRPLLLSILLGVAPAGVAASPLLIDNFEYGGSSNLLGNPAHFFSRAPSSAVVSRRVESVGGKKTQVLALQYRQRDLKTKGPGWCGYYTRLGRGKAGYLDATGLKAVTFWVRGETGREKFIVGLVDQTWEKAGDSARSKEIGRYLPAGQVTREWQKAVIPAAEFYADFKRLTSIVFIVDESLFPAGGHAGTIYIDDLALEKYS